MNYFWPKFLHYKSFLIKISDKDGFRDDVVEPGVTTLRHVTRDRGDENGEMGTWAQTARRQCQTIIPTIIQLLEPKKASWPTIKATVGLIRNLAHDKKVLYIFIFLSTFLFFLCFHC